LSICNVDEMSQASDWKGKNVLVIGIARQGIALTRYLTHHGANVIVNDRRQLDQLQEAREALHDLPIKWIVGSHPVSMLDEIDLICISGGVPSDLPIVVEAHQRGIPISNDSQIFLDACPCKVIGITGSAGKTTTTTLVGLIAQAAVEELGAIPQEVIEIDSKPSYINSGSRIWVGGNIGSPLISVVDQIKPNDLAVMELSSFQLEIMESSPHIAAVLNITPNHLDRHKSMENYRDAKSRILTFQTSQDVAIINLDDPVVRDLQNNINGRLVVFSKQEIAGDVPSLFFNPETETVQISHSLQSGERVDVINLKDIPLRGEHNLMNVIASCAIAHACGISPMAMESGVKKFDGIAHRLEFVRSWGGGDWYNDSIATAPERAVAAINAFSEPIILLAGGRDKDLPWDSFAALVSRQVKHLILFGEAAGEISKVMSHYKKGSTTTVTSCPGLKAAVDMAAKKISPGDVVLLSPGGTSFDEFTDFEERGEAFTKWVMELV